MYFVDLAREYHAKNDYIDLEGAIEQAIEQCIREDVLKEFLISKKLRKNKSLEQIADELEETPDAIRPLYEQARKELESDC